MVKFYEPSEPKAANGVYRPPFSEDVKSMIKELPDEYVEKNGPMVIIGIGVMSLVASAVTALVTSAVWWMIIVRYY